MQVVRPCVPSYDDEIRGAGFVRNQITDVLRFPAPFRVPDVPGRGMKFPPDIGENSQFVLPAVCFL